MPFRIQLARFPLVDYATAWRWQLETAAALRAGDGGEALAILQHSPVYTFGRRARTQHLLVEEADLAQRGATLVHSDRGGDVTFHGPGQLIAYPILDLRRRGLGAADYVRRLEAVVIDCLAHFGLAGQRVPGRPGVWLPQGKVAALGLRISGGVSTHGFALNVETDLDWFYAIVPCGLSDARATSMQAALGFSPGMREVEDVLSACFAGVFDSECAVAEAVSAGELVASHGR